MPQIVLSTAFQSVLALGPVRNYFLAGGTDGLEIRIEGARTALGDPVELLTMSGPSARAVLNNDLVRFVRYQVIKGAIGGASIWVDGTVASGSGVDSATAAIEFIYKPSGPAVPELNIFSDWAAMLADIGALPASIGPVVKFVESCVVPLIGMPVTGWNMNGGSWRGFTPATNVVGVLVGPGVIIDNFGAGNGFTGTIGDGLTVEVNPSADGAFTYSASTPGGPPIVFVTGPGARLVNVGGFAFSIFKTPGAGSQTYFVYASFGATSYAPQGLVVRVAGTDVVIAPQSAGAFGLQDGWIEGPLGTFLQYQQGVEATDPSIPLFSGAVSRSFSAKVQNIVGNWTVATRPPHPTVPSVGYNSDLPGLEYWNGVAWTAIAGAAKAPQDGIVYQPGGATAGITYATWAEIESAVNAVEGALTVYLDNSLTNPVPIPNTANLDGKGRLKLAAISSLIFGDHGAPIDVTIDDGGRLLNVFEIEGPMTISVTPSAVSPFQYTTPYKLLNLKNQATIKLGFFGTAVSAITADILRVTLDNSSLRNQGPGGAIGVLEVSSGATLVMTRMETSTFLNNCVVGAGNLTLWYDASVSPLPTFPNVAGTVTLTPIDHAAAMAAVDTAPLLGSMLVQGQLDALKTYGGWLSSVLTQTDWYVDYQNGSDANSGLLGFPVQHLSEVRRRLGSGFIDGIQVTIHVAYQAGIPDPTNYDIAWPIINGAVLWMLGERSIQASYQLSAVTAWNGAGQVIGDYTLSGAPDLTALGYAESYFVQEQAPNTNQCAPIGLDLGAGQFRAAWCDLNTSTSFEPALLDNVDVYDVPTFSGTCYFESTSAGSFIWIQDLRFSSNIQHSGPGPIQHFGTSLTNLASTEGTNDLNLFGSQLHGNTVVIGGNIWVGVTVYDALAVYASAILSLQGNIYMQGVSLPIGDDNFGPANVTLNFGGSVGIADYTGVALTVGPGSLLNVTTGYLFAVNGVAQPNGIIVNSKGEVIYVAGFIPVVAGTLPVVEWLVGGAPFPQAGIAAASYMNPNNGACVAKLE